MLSLREPPCLRSFYTLLELVEPAHPLLQLVATTRQFSATRLGDMATIPAPSPDKARSSFVVKLHQCVQSSHDPSE